MAVADEDAAAPGMSQPRAAVRPRTSDQLPAAREVGTDARQGRAIRAVAVFVKSDVAGLLRFLKRLAHVRDGSVGRRDHAP